jgi:hypothetical protein
VELAMNIKINSDEINDNDQTFGNFGNPTDVFLDEEY